VLGVPDTIAFRGIAVGRALKNRCEYFAACVPFPSSSSLSSATRFTTIAAAPAVYAKTWEEDRLSKAVGEDTVVPIIRLRDKPDS